MFTDPVEPVEVLFYWSEAVLGNFYWPGASGSLIVSSPGIENICFSNTLLARRVLARISKMPVQNSNFKFFFKSF